MVLKFPSGGGGPKSAGSSPSDLWPELCDFLRIYIADGPSAIGMDAEMPALNGHEAAAREFVRQEPAELSSAAVVQAHAVLESARVTLHEDFRDIANRRFDTHEEFRAWLKYVLEVLEHERERVANPIQIEVGAPGWAEALANDYVRPYMINPPDPGRMAWASSFPDRAVAERACEYAIEYNEHRVGLWFESGRGHRLVVEAPCAAPIGYGFGPDESRWESRTVRVIISRTSDGEWGVENAYPIPDPPSR